MVQYKVITRTDAQGNVEYWNHFLGQWQKDRVRYIAEYGDEYFETVKKQDNTGFTINLEDAND